MMRCVDAVRAFFLSSSSFPSSSLSLSSLSLSRLRDSKERRAKRRVLLSEIWNLCLQKSLLVHSFCISHHEYDHSRKKKRRETTTTTICQREKWSLFSRKSRLLVVNRRPLLKDTGETKTPLLKERKKSADSFSRKKKSPKKEKEKEKKCFRETTNF